MRDIYNCPFCEAEVKGYSTGWGGSPEFWKEMKEKHEKEHLIPTQGEGERREKK